MIPRMRQTVPDGTYVELVRSLFSTLLLTTIMAVSFVSVAAIVIVQAPDPFLEDLALAGSLAAIARIVVVAVYRKRAQNDRLEMEEARQLEKYFAAAYLTFACLFGAFSARAFWVAPPDTRILVVGLVFGYAAGVAAGISYRPRISVTSMLVSVVPTIVVAACMGNATYLAASVLLAIFLLGGVQSVLSRYRTAASGITLRRHFSRLAKSDALTGLSNRLALSEAFDLIVAEGAPDRVVAIHCLDLDKFKPVNDRFGHPVGDKILCAVAERLKSLVRVTDYAARVGGDEFIVIQSDITHAGEAELLGRRIVRTLEQPFGIDGHQIRIGTSVGFALSSPEAQDLDTLIANADEALLRAKSGGRGRVVAHDPMPIVSLRRTG